MGATADEIVDRYNNLWQDLKNKKFTKLPEIDIKDLEESWINKLRDSIKNKSDKQRKFVNSMHYINDQLHFIRTIKDSEL